MFKSGSQAEARLNVRKNPSFFGVENIMKKFRKWGKEITIGAFVTIASLYLIQKYYYSR